MTNRLALVLSLMIATAIVVDVVLNGTGNLVFLGKKFYNLIEWIAFWR
ncbi:hypothetical protein I5535_12790 [Rhodobacteraceae bacterium F11138]|nr:hypothetical protein [Rhodobacteraceae bacterium F11138]